MSLPDIVKDPPTQLELVAIAFAVLAFFANLNGRRLDYWYRRSTWKLVPVQHGSPMLTAKMAPRKQRRAKQGKDFKPVYGYLGGGFGPRPVLGDPNIGDPVCSG